MKTKTDYKTNGLRKLNNILFALFVLSFTTLGYSIFYANFLNVSAASFDFVIDPVEVESITIDTQNSSLNIMPSSSIQIVESLVPHYTTTKQVNYIIVSGNEFATITASGLLTAKANAVIGSKIVLQATADSAVSNELTLTVVKIPVSTFTINSNDTYTVQQNTSLQLTYFAEPTNASYKNKISFSIISGQEFGTVNNTGRVFVNNNISVADAKIVVVGYADGVMSNEITIVVYIPVDNVALTADKTTVNSASYYSDSVTFETQVNENASIQTPTYNILSGGEYVQSFVNGVLTVKQNITNKDAIIMVSAVVDGVSSNEITININIPVEYVVFENAALRSVHNLMSYDLKALALPTHATNTSITYSLNVSADKATIDENGVLYIYKNATAGTVIVVTARASGNITNTIILTVMETYATEISSISVQNANGEISASNPIMPGDILYVSPTLKPFNVSYTFVTYDVKEGNLVSIIGKDTSQIISKDTNSTTLTNDVILKIASLNEIFSDVPIITISAQVSSGGGEVVTITKQYQIFVPVQSVILEQETINRGEQTPLTFFFNQNNQATNKQITYLGYSFIQSNVSSLVRVEVSSDVKTVMVSARARGNTEIRLNFRADNGYTFFKIVKVSLLDFNNLSFEYGQDDNGVAIDNANPQIEENVEAAIIIKYGQQNAEPYILNYDLVGTNTENVYLSYATYISKISGVLVDTYTHNYKVAYYSDGIKLSRVEYKFYVYDGLRNEILVGVFNSSFNVFYRVNEDRYSYSPITHITQKDTDIKALFSTESYVTSDYSLKISVLNMGYSTSENGVVSVDFIGYAHDDDITFEATYIQKYNGQDIVYKTPKLYELKRGFISHRDHLAKLKNNSKTYYLINDLDLTGWSPWTNFTGIDGFTGKLWGNDKTISNFELNIYRSSDDNSAYGLFKTSTNHINCLTITNSKIYYEVNHAGNSTIYVGLLVGYNSGFIGGIVIDNSSVTVHRTNSVVGLIAGMSMGGEHINYAHVKNSTLMGNGDLGGIVGSVVNDYVYYSIIENIKIEIYTAYTNRGVGLVAGSATNSEVSYMTIYNNTISFIGYGGIDQKDLNPYIGWAIGYSVKSVVWTSTRSGNTFVQGTLTSNYKYGGVLGMFQSTQDQLKYCLKGDNKFFGIIFN